MKVRSEAADPSPARRLVAAGSLASAAIERRRFLIGSAAAAALVSARRTLSAFVASALAMLGIIGTAGAAMFPFIMPSSSMPSASLTVWDSVSSPMTLALMLGATVIFMPLIVLYTSWAYRVMRGKVTVEHIRANEHSAY